MDLEDDVLPEEYVDVVMQEFTYDPIKLSSTEDPSQVLYNRRTLETIWDTKHTAINPYTRQPFHIRNVIPQTELKQQMEEYIHNNRSVTLRLGLQVIPDYTQILNETEMKELLNELVLAGNRCLRLLKKKKRRRDHGNRKPDDEELEHWKALWKKLNLVRLYCQYRAENREVFSSIKGYDYLFQVINKQLLYSCREYSRSSCDEAKEVRKELARIVDVMGGLKQKDLLMAPEKSVLAFVRILSDLKHSGYLKIQSMVLRIYRGMFEDSIHYLARSEELPIYYMVEHVLYVLSRWDSWRDITNEDLDNGMAILKAAVCISKGRLLECPGCVKVICMVVTVCISRLQELHDAVSAHQSQTISSCSSHQDDHEDAIYSSSSSTVNQDDDNGEVKKSINLINTVLYHGLILIYTLLTLPYSEEEPHRYTSSRDVLRSTDILRQIVRMVKLVLADNKFVHSSHLYVGLSITVALYKEEGSLSGMTKTELVRVFEDFLGSKYVNEYGIPVKHLVQYIHIVYGPCGRRRQL